MKSSLFLFLCAFSLSACAQAPAPQAAAKPNAAAPNKAAAAAAVKPGTAEQRARDAILSLNPRVTIDRIAAAPMPGFREVIVGGQVLYVSDNGRYVMQGALFDVVEKKDLSQAGLAEVRRQLLATIPDEDRIVFAPAKPKYTVSVFTDVECGYCRRMHNDIAEYNRQGIAIEYLAFPRRGLGSEDFRKMVAVWCAPDRRKAMTDAKNDRRVPMKTCTNPVTMHYDIGQRVGLAGTPMIVTESGVAMPGYMPPAELRAALDKLAAESPPAKTGGAGSR